MTEQSEDGGGDYLMGAELTALARFLGWFRRTILRRPDPVAVLKRRQAIRTEIGENLTWPDRDPSPEVLIVKLGKHDKYGQTDRRLVGRGASDWFKAEVKELHDRGLELFSALEYVRIRKGRTAYRVDPDEFPDARKVWVVGRIPYERIAFIDWRPDPNYSSPRFYVAYNWRREAFTEVVLYEGSPSDHLSELHDVKYKGEGGGPLKRLQRFLRRIRMNWQFRRMDRPGGAG